MVDYSHLNALQDRLFREEQRLAVATTERERVFRRHEIMMVEREIAGEYRFLGIDPPAPMSLDEIMSDDDLLRELRS